MIPSFTLGAYIMMHLWIWCFIFGLDLINKNKKKEKICKQLDIITPCALSQEDDCHSSQRDFLSRHVNQVKPRSQAFSTCFSLGPLWALIPSRQVSKVWSLAHFVSEFVRATGLRERKWRGYYRGIQVGLEAVTVFIMTKFVKRP